MSEPEIDDIRHIIAQDIEKRIIEKHKQWLKDSFDLCRMGGLSLELSLKIISIEMVTRAVNAIAAGQMSIEVLLPELGAAIQRIRDRHNEAVEKGNERERGAAGRSEAAG